MVTVGGDKINTISSIIKIIILPALSIFTYGCISTLAMNPVALEEQETNWSIE